MTSDSVWSLNKLPGEVGILGGGFVGLEIGQALHRLGSSVRIIKKHDTIARGIEREVGSELKEQTREEIEEARKEIESGKFVTHEQVKKDLGL